MTDMSIGRRDEYIDFCKGVRDACGIDLLQYKRSQMERRVRSFIQTRGAKGLAYYLDLVRSDGDELNAFLDRVTINVSSLWRNPEQWKVLSDQVLPELAQQGRVRAWSAGCSYGAEAFTLAATCAELGLAGVRIQGTDIDPRMIERARAGVFSKADAQDAPPALLQRWFEELDGGYAAKQELHRLVRFERGDLLQQPIRKASHDLVLCRNTVIYFLEDVRDALHARLVDSLRPGGVLVIGATERVTNPDALGLETIMPFTYRKVVA